MMDLGEFLPDWAASLVSTLGLYFVLFIIGYFVINFVQKNPVGPSDRSLYARFARWFVFGYPEDEDYRPVGTDEPQADDASTSSKDQPKEISYVMKALLLAFCTCGLLGSYLLWGVLQERVMTTDYTDGRFKSSTFLVFCNRLLALIVAIAVTSFTEQPKVRSPHYKYSFTSLSNVLSSWCQLEALKYISFPTQVLAKSSKMIPVMIMGKVISRKSYPMYDYVVAIVIGLGVAMFTLYSSDDSSSNNNNDKTTSISGIILIVGYLTFDSFTSQWQGHLFREYKMSSYQMMYGVNYFSCLFTFLSLLQSQELFSSISFIMGDPIIGFHIFLFSVAGATGQMFIFYTIKQFGPLVFTMIMTTRQLIAIILSCILYGHALTGMSMLGAFVVFGAVLYRIYRQQKEKKEKKTSPKANPSPSVELKIANKA